MRKKKRRSLLHRLPQWLIYWGTIAGSVAAIIGLWLLLGLPVPAWSSDVSKLNRQQTIDAIALYRGSVRNSLVTGPPKDPTARRYWEEDLRNARESLNAVEQRMIQLSK